MSQTLGYHRLPTTKVESNELLTKKYVFWSVYALDKGLSLRLGRCSIIQDCDISTTLPATPEEPKLLCWHQLTETWIEFARYQGRVFTELYTVASLSGPQAARENKARKLAAEIQQWRQRKTAVSHKFHECLFTFGSNYHQMMSVPDSNTPHSEGFEEARDSTNVVYFSVLTIVYQAIPATASSFGISSVFYSECLISARKALECHRSAISKFKEDYAYWRSYIHW
jgi:hypothetical protein